MVVGVLARAGLVSLPEFLGEPDVGRRVYGSLDSPGYVCSIRVAGHVVEVAASFQSGAVRSSARRGAVSGFSAASRRRLFRVASAVDWSVYGQSLFVTLTYPSEFPLDGRRVKRDLAAFRRAWARKFGLARGMWKLEFQRRGAPHLHLALVVGERVDLRAVRAWAAAEWYRIVGSGDDRHLLAGVQVDVLAANPAAYYAGYVGGSKGSKEYQHSVPEGFESVGRFWGVWSLSVPWACASLSYEDFVRVRRLLFAYGRSRSFRSGRRPPARVQGCWQYVEGSALLFVTSLARGSSGVAALGVLAQT